MLVFSGQRQHHFLFSYQIKSETKPGEWTHWWWWRQGTDEEIFVGKKFSGQSAQLIFLNTKEKCDIHTNNSHYVTLLFSDQSEELSCLLLSEGLVVGLVDWEGRVGSERAMQSVILRSQHSYTTTQQWASAAAAADLHSTGLAQPAWPALGRTLLGSEELSRHLPCLPCLYQPRTHCQTPLSLLEAYLPLFTLQPQQTTGNSHQDIQNRLFWNWNQYYKI